MTTLKQKADQSLNSPDTSFVGQMDVTVKEAEITIHYQTKTQNGVKQFVAGCTPADEENPPHLVDFMQDIFPDFDPPDGFAVDFTGGVIVTQKQGGTSKWLLGLDLTLSSISLSELPLIGNLSDDSTNIVNSFRVIVASQPFKASEVNQANLTLTAVKSEAPPLPVPASSEDSKIVIKKGFTLSSSLSFGEVEKPLALPISGGKDGEETPSAPTGDGASSDDYAVWYKVQKSVGPLTIEKVGGQYNTEDKELLLLFTSDIKVGPFGLGLQGLGIGLPLEDGGSPSFHLDGFSIAYEKPPLELGGAFLRRELEKDGEKYVEYDGMVVLQVDLKGKTLGLGAIGSYAYYKGQPSLFIYALLNYPLGGPPFFFVTGLAGGFGYNRALTMPDIKDVGTFPMVAEASDGGYTASGGLAERINTELEKIDKYISPELGAGFLALGIKFTSFKMIDAFALAILTWGDSISINLLGVATLTVPTAEAGKEITPLGMAKLLIKVTVDLGEGLVAAMAELDPSSYILSTACHLTGGFAFYIWFAGEHTGDFVITLGGYNKAFDAPKHYPEVPRLGFNWQIDDSALLKGDLYFALCAHALMAGGHVEASYQRGSVKAWFRAGLDFLISWKPYHYAIRVYVDLGASVGIISVDVGADVSLSGPEFGGKAKISLWIVHFTVTFGDQNGTEVEPIGWDNFKQSFLPDGSEKSDASMAMSFAQQSEQKAVCTLAVNRGLIKQTDDLHIINPKDFALSTNSLIPAKQAQMSNGDSLSLAGAQTEFGISPMNLNHSQVSTTHTIHVTREGSTVDDWFNYEPVLKKAPAGLWGQSMSHEINGTRFIENALTGYELTAKPPIQPHETTEVSAANLRYSLEQDEIEHYQWQTIEDFETISSNASQETLLAALGF